jgi:Protein of unknown function (DUF3892)/PASTA domain
VCVPIQWVSQDNNGTITHVGGSSRRGVVWGLSKAEAASLIQQELWEFFVEVGGARVPVFAVDRSGSTFLTTSPDGLGANNLDNLPMNPQPVAGVLPEFPLSIPGVKTMSLMRITSVQYASGGQLRSLVSQVLAPGTQSTKVTTPSSFWTQTPRWLYFDVLVPFPCEVTVHELTSLTRVPGDSPAARRALEDAGKGWWSMDYVLTRPDGTIDPTKPTRMTEARIIVRPPALDWQLGRVYIGIDCWSLNTYCYTGAGTSLSGREVAISLTKPTAPPPPKTTVTVPNVVGQRLDLALSMLWAAKFTVTVVGPTDVSTNLQVATQDLAPGTMVEEGAGILVSTHVITPASGVKSLSIANQSNRAVALDIWLFDYTTGHWSKETTVDYRDTGDVAFDEGHVYWVAAVDDTTPLCDTGRPDEPACVYATPARNFTGDVAGAAVPWTIT